MRKRHRHFLSIFVVLIFSLLISAETFPQNADGPAASKKSYSTSLKIKVLQKHDKEPVESASVHLSVGENEYEDMTGSSGNCTISNIKLGNIILGKGHLRIEYRDTVLWEKNIVVLNIPRNNLTVHIKGDVERPSTPRLNHTYNYTSETPVELSGKKDIYSSVYINRDEFVPADASGEWKRRYPLRRGLNTLAVSSKNIWGAESEPYVFHITYFPVSEGKINVLQKPGNMRVERNSACSTISWDWASDPDIIGYNVYRSKESGTSYRKINYTLVKRNTYTDTHAGEEDYFYTVTAVYPEYETAFSNEVSSVFDTLKGTDIPDRIKKNMVLVAGKSPYLVSTEVKVDPGATLKIGPGVEVMFKKGKTSIAGTIIAEGTEEAPVSFVSAQESSKPGDWLGIEMRDGSKLINAIIKNAGRNKHDAVLVSGNTSVENNTISGNAHNGIGIREDENGSNTLISGNRITNNKNSGINFYDSVKKSYTKITGNNISENGSYGIVAGANSDISGNRLQDNEAENAVKIEGDLISRNITWDNGVYMVSSMEISEGAGLSLEPGVIVKASSGAVISGKILAEGDGTSSGAVVFTSEKDKAYGEGATALALVGRTDEVGTWGGLELTNGSRLKNCTVNYTLGEGIIALGEDVDMIRVDVYMVMEESSLLGLSRLSRRAMGVIERSRKKRDKRLSAEFILLLVVVIPASILLLIMGILKNRKHKQ